MLQKKRTMSVAVDNSGVEKLSKSIAIKVNNFENLGRIHCLTKTWFYLTPYVIRMYWTSFWQPTFHVQQNVFEKTPIKVGSSHLYTSFGIFWVQSGQFLEAQWVFEKCLKTVKSLFSKENYVDIEIFRKFKISLCLE